MLARLTRFERATTAFGGQYSIQLSYRRVGGEFYRVAAGLVQCLLANLRVSVEEGGGGLKTLGVVTVCESINPYLAIGGRGMHKALPANIDPDM